MVFPELSLDRYHRTIGSESQSLSCLEQEMPIWQFASVTSHYIRTPLTISGTPATVSDQFPVSSLNILLYSILVRNLNNSKVSMEK